MPCFTKLHNVLRCTLKQVFRLAWRKRKEKKTLPVIINLFLIYVLLEVGWQLFKREVKTIFFYFKLLSHCAYCFSQSFHPGAELFLVRKLTLGGSWNTANTSWARVGCRLGHSWRAQQKLSCQLCKPHTHTQAGMHGCVGDLCGGLWGGLWGGPSSPDTHTGWQDSVEKSQ